MMRKGASLLTASPSLNEAAVRQMIARMTDSFHCLLDAMSESAFNSF
jgi:hypothetical protein